MVPQTCLEEGLREDPKQIATTGLQLMKKTLLSLLAVAAMSTTALAADVKPALVYGCLLYTSDAADE